MRLETTERFDSDREHQFRWYLTETELEPAAALELAERFARAVDYTLDLISRTPEIGRRRFPEWTEAEVRSFCLQRPFHRFLVYYSIESVKIRAIRLLEGHRKSSGLIGTEKLHISCSPSLSAQFADLRADLST